MKKLLIIMLVIAGCNSADSDNTQQDLKTDQNTNNDTRTVNPADTSKHLDTGSYDKMSDTLRKM